MMSSKSKQRFTILIILFILIGFNTDLTAQYAGGSGTIGDPFLIETAEQLNGIGLNQDHWDKHFLQTADIDLSVYSGDQFNIIGIEANGGENLPFTGTFDGNGYEIRNFTYESSERGVAIFELVDYPGVLKNIILVDPVIDCPQSTGVAALVFALFNGIVDSGKVIGGSITGGWGVGGLVSNYWATDAPAPGAGTTKIINCYVTGTVSGNADYTGGLTGINHGRIQKCCSSGSVSGKNYVGGLSPYNGYWAEYNTLHGEISDCYSTSSVSGTSKVGGLVGEAGSSTSINNCYAIGEVSGTNAVGGLVGSGSLTVQHSFWDTITSGIAVSHGGTGLSTDEMQDPETFQNAEWDMINTWLMQGNPGYPKLLSLMDIPTKIPSNNPLLLPLKIELEQNYPNPFSSDTKIKYNLPAPTHIIISIYNIEGRKIATLVNKYHTAGEHQINLTADGLSNGIYFYRLESGGFSEIKEIVLTK